MQVFDWYLLSQEGCYLHSVGGLVPFLGYLRNSHAQIRAKAADVLTTIVQNNPRSQQLVKLMSWSPYCPISLQILFYSYARKLLVPYHEKGGHHLSELEQELYSYRPEGFERWCGGFGSYEVL